TPRATLFPYTTLFRSLRGPLTESAEHHAKPHAKGQVARGHCRTQCRRQLLETAVRCIVPFLRHRPRFEHFVAQVEFVDQPGDGRSEEHTSELQSRENL